MRNDCKWLDEFVSQLMRLSYPDEPERGTLAHLRRSLGESDHRILGKAGWLFVCVPDCHLSDAILIAGLFAFTKGECPQRDHVDFGLALGSLSGARAYSNLERRFIDLLDTDKVDLPHKLRQALCLIARERIGLDWKLFLKHLDGWDHADRRVQKRWARNFWAFEKLDLEDYEPVGVS